MEVVFHWGCLSSNFKFQYFPGWGWGGGGWEESIIRLISAEAEAEALLGLVELGNIQSIRNLRSTS